MATNSKIEWTNKTWNPIRGCSVVSPGCKNCYAMKQAHRFSGPGGAYEGLTQLTSNGPVWTGKVKFVPEHLADPLKWREPRRVFVNSMSDLFHEDVSDEQIETIFGVMALAQKHTFQVLTKRPERMLKWFKENNGPMETCEQGVQRHSEFTGKIVWDSRGSQPHLYHRATPASVSNRRVWPGWPLPNVWLGVSCENQKTADERIPLLLSTPAKVRWVSCEPLLGPVDLTRIAVKLANPRYDLGDPTHASALFDHAGDTAKLDWAVIGGESGPHARPMHPDWARSLRDQCKAAGVPFFFKQWGEWAPGEMVPSNRAYPTQQFFNGTWKECSDDWATEKDGGSILYRIGKKAAGRLLDGVEHSEYPLHPSQCNCSGSRHAIGSQGCTMEAVSG